MTELRRSASGRFSGALWGFLVAGCGALMIASFSGFDVDFELAAIIALCGIGLWLLLTALFASGSSSRAKQRVAEPVGTMSADEASTEAATAAEGDVEADVRADAEPDILESSNDASALPNTATPNDTDAAPDATTETDTDPRK
jgi:hypothetical protein